MTDGYSIGAGLTKSEAPKYAIAMRSLQKTQRLERIKAFFARLKFWR